LIKSSEYVRWGEEELKKDKKKHHMNFKLESDRYISPPILSDDI